MNRQCSETEMMSIKLYFKDKQGEERFIAECATVQDCHKQISEFMDKHSYKNYYFRSFGHNDDITIDVGSYSEFFKIKGITYDEYWRALHEE